MSQSPRSVRIRWNGCLAVLLICITVVSSVSARWEWLLGQPPTPHEVEKAKHDRNSNQKLVSAHNSYTTVDRVYAVTGGSSSTTTSVPTAGQTTSTEVVSTSTSTAPLVDATSSPYILTNGATVKSTISISNDSDAAAFFSLALLGDEQLDSIYVTLSLCSGPDEGVIAQMADNGTVSSSEKHSILESSLARLYVSTTDSIEQPGPENVPSKDDGGMAYAWGGFASVELNSKKDDQVGGVWIGVWPPAKGWNVVNDSFIFELVVSSGAPLQAISNSYGIMFDDTDQTRALVTSFDYSASASPNLTLILLPTNGRSSAPSAYYNNSVCAIANAWENYTSSEMAPTITASQTTRFTELIGEDDVYRMQFEMSNLQRGTNYTAWLVEANSTNTTLEGNVGITMYPAIKFATKSTDACRLVYDVDFCPEVAYSIPVNASVSTADALSVINETMMPNYVNFSKTLSTFPCDSEYYGSYSSSRGCSDCLASYQTWLCSMTMPRCTDPVQTPEEDSAAEPNVTYLTGKEGGYNTGVLPYVVNRVPLNDSMPYISTELAVSETYGQVLPCIYVCLFVQRDCPAPLFAWTCPAWDVSAQADYGTFADAGSDGFGAGQNGGAGSNLDRWGGPLRYIAQDNFGNVYCTAVGVDKMLRLQSGVKSTLRIGMVGGWLGGVMTLLSAVWLAIG